MPLSRVAVAWDGSSDPQQNADPLAEQKAILAQENWTEAASAFLRFVRKNPTSPHAGEASFWVGYCQVKSQNFEQAIHTLQPFVESRSEEKWADDALLQLGHAYQGAGEGDLALECWKRLVEKYPESIWRHETLLNIVNLLYAAARFDECSPYCQQVMTEIADPNATWETRYIGAFCLNAQQRFDDAERWIERWFDRTRAVHEAYRTVLAAQRHLVEGRSEAATQAIASIQRDFTDLESGEWIDVLMRASFMLRRYDQRDQARSMLLDAVPRLAGQPEYLIHSLLTELDAVLGDDRLDHCLSLLTQLAADESWPPNFRAVLRDRLVADLRQAQKLREAAELLERWRDGEQAEFLRYRAAILLSDVLANDLNEREAAATALDELLPTLKRRDFTHDVQTRLREIRPPGAP
jgi:tetratricopeptide (TPR) repeat protein